MEDKTTHIQLWDKCRQIIRDNLPEEQYNVWFKDITSYEFKNGVLTLVVPSSYFVEHLEERYIRILAPAIRKVYGPNVNLFYQYDQVAGQPDSAVNQMSSSPSGAILEQKKSQAANPFRAVPESDIDPQLNPRYTFENYCEGESNKIACAIGRSIADNIKNNTFNPLFLYGPTGVGKTHLIQAIGIRIKEKNPDARVLYVTARLFESQYTAAVSKKDDKKDINSFFRFYQSIDALIIDDIQDLHGKTGTQNTFFHIFNHLHQNNKKIIMSSDCAPAEMEGFEARLLSRFRWGMSAELGLPDYDLRRKVLERKAQQNGLSISKEVIDYIATSVTSSIRDLEGVIVSLVAHSMVQNGEITLALARTVVERAVKINRKSINFELVVEKVCTYYGVDTDLIFTKTRKREVSDARQVVMYMAKKMAKMPLVTIGQRLDRTHATVSYAIAMIEDRIAIDKQLQSDLSNIESTLTD